MSSPPRSRTSTGSTSSHRMHRQDSGYESQSSSRRSHQIRKSQHLSESSLRRSKPRVPTTTASSQTSITYPYPVIPSPFDPHSEQTSSPLFPYATRSNDDDDGKGTQPQQSVPLPPPTTHYWTSDATRRIEYAEIDAANKGIRGWLRRHLLPDCFTGCGKHIAFDDDSGSVRRYRLELEEPREKMKGKTKEVPEWFGL